MKHPPHPQDIIGKLYSAPALIPVGQREVTAFSRV